MPDNDTMPVLDLSRSASKRAAILAALVGHPMTIKDFGLVHGITDARTINRLRTSFTGLMDDGLVTYHRDGEGNVLRDGGPLFAVVETAPTASTHAKGGLATAAPSGSAWSWRDVIPAPEGTRRTLGVSTTRRRA